MVLPDKKVEETFDDAFPDKATADEWRADPLVQSSAPMVKPAMSAFSSLGACWGAATQVATPFMVRTLASRASTFSESLPETVSGSWLQGIHVYLHTSSGVLPQTCVAAAV